MSDMNFNVDAGGVPEELKERERWVCWHSPAWKDGSSKVPMQPVVGDSLNASTTDPGTWGTFEQAMKTANARDGWGVGYVFGDESNDHDRPDEYVGVDIDGALDADGNLREWVPELHKFAGIGWVERSTGGRGLHLVLRGEGDGSDLIPDWWVDQGETTEGDGGPKEREVAAYSGGRFFTVTGDLWGPGLPADHDAAEFDDPDPAVEGDRLGATRWDDWLTGAWFVFNDDPPAYGGDDAGSTASTAGVGGSDRINQDPGVVVNDVLRGTRLALNERVAHPVHGSDTGTNFQVDDGGDSWRCWRHDCTGNPMHLVGMQEGIIQCGEWSGSGLSSDTWADIYDAARDRGIDVPDRDSARSDGSHVIQDPEAGSSADESGGSSGEDGAANRVLPTPDGLHVKEGGYARERMKDGDVVYDQVTNFQLETRNVLEVEHGSEDYQMDLTVHTAEGEEHDITVSPKVFNEKRSFKNNVVTGLTTTFAGGERELNDLRRFVGAQDAPRLTATRHMGRHGDEFVFPGGSLTVDGWADREVDAEYSYVERHVGAEKKVAIEPEETSAEFDTETVAQACELIPQTREFDRLGPALGWFYASAFRPLIMDETGQFNILNVTGETGSGKTATLRTLWRLFGMDGDPLSANDTFFTTMGTLAASNAVPMWFDEFKPSDMSERRLDGFLELLRKSTSGGVEQRGNTDESHNLYRIQAPAVISGEERVHGSAEERRSIFTSFRKSATAEGTDTAQAFAQLVGGSATVDGDTVHYQGVGDLHDHALAYYRHALGLDAAEVRDAWRKSRRHVDKLLAEENVGRIEDMVEQGLQTVHFGLSVFRHFATEHGADDPLTDAQVDDAIRYAAGGSFGGANREDHVDSLFNVASRAAAEGELEQGHHYGIVHAGATRPTELRINLSRSLDTIGEYARTYEVAEDILNSKDDYDERLRDAVNDESSYVTGKSIPVSGVGRTVSVLADDAADELDHFTLANFDPSLGDVAAVTPDAGEAAAGSGEAANAGMEAAATPLSGLDPQGTNGFFDLTVEVLRVGDDLPGFLADSGTFVDETGMMNYVTYDRNEPVPTEFVEGETYLIENAELGTDSDGAMQIELDGRLADVTPIDQGTGYTEGGDPGPNSTLDAGRGGGRGGADAGGSGGTGGETATDGGQPGGDGRDDSGSAQADQDGSDTEAEPIDDTTHDVREVVRTEGPCEEPALIARLAERGIDPDTAKERLKTMYTNGELYKRPDDQKVALRS